MDLEGYEGYSVHFQLNRTSYPQGNASWELGGQWLELNTAYNTEFRAEFAAVPEPGTGFILAFGITALLVLYGRRTASRLPRWHPA